MTAAHYDEFGLLHENAAEFGLRYDPSDPPRVERRSVPVGDGEHVSALLWGEGPAEIVLLHGGAQNAHTWDTVCLALGRSVLAIDLPGHGHSSHREDHAYWPGENARAVVAALEAFEVTPRLVVGMSLGGLTSVALSGQAPHLVPRLLLVDVTPGVDREKASAIVQFVNGPEYFESFEEILERTITFNPTRSEASLRRGVIHNAVPLPDGRWRWRYDLPRIGEGEGESGRVMPGLDDLWEAIGRYEGHLTLARGALSPVVSDDDVAELRRRRPDVHVEVFEQAGHSIQGDRPLELACFIAGLVP